jgi:Ser/Thr protein kinase RdoA (MazF antagonist)
MVATYVPQLRFSGWRKSVAKGLKSLKGLTSLNLSRTGEDKLFAAVIGRARETQRAPGDEPETFGLIHGDLHQDNYLFHRGDLRAIDCDDCGWATCSGILP